MIDISISYQLFGVICFLGGIVFGMFLRIAEKEEKKNPTPRVAVVKPHQSRGRR